ncbi:MAG TPA: DNA polymerase III subunit gamma/tau [Stellaceae bacterium]|jgi:DNA polymerase-3 subunit gamma/tau
MSDPANAYRVLARKYRPQSFAELIGQEAMVRTLSNAIAGGRVAHAFMLTGVRGVGKTTTARIIARALNCVGRDGAGGPTIEPCGECVHCRDIALDRHVDVIEMDAASHAGVNEIRDLTDGVRYRPVSARSKVYIIDEVHMLSKQAFDALLKTLEEPPPATVFVLATTEIHKVPVTVLSRCQRFALRRVPVELLLEHYRKVAAAEMVEAEPEALALIARAADGSVRDGLSLLDQAIALADGRLTQTAVRDMLGVADRGQIFELLEEVLHGEAAAALARLDRLHAEGADPLLVLQDLLDLGHFLTRLKLAPEAGAGDPIAEGDRERARPLADALTMPALARLWQMLLKGLGEVQAAPSPIQAAQMVLVRLAYVADLPAPAELVRALSGGLASGAAGNGPAAGAMHPPGSAALPRQQHSGAPVAGAPPLAGNAVRAPLADGEPGAEPVTRAPAPALDYEPMPQSFGEILALFDRRREAVLRSQLASYCHLVHFEPGRIEFRAADGAPRNLANRLGQLLGEWTGMRWLIAVSEAEGAPTLLQQEQRRDRELRNEVAGHPLVQAVLETFPGATIAAIRERFAPAAETEAAESENSEGDEPETEEE